MNLREYIVYGNHPLAKGINYFRNQKYNNRIYNSIANLSLNPQTWKLQNTRISFQGTNHQINAGTVLIINGDLSITGNQHQIVLGKDVILENCQWIIQGNNNKLYIGDHCRLRNTRIWIEDENTCIQIGEATTSEGLELSVAENGGKITIGKDCMFAHGIDVRNTDSHSIIDNTSGKRINPAANITIEDHVWIGSHAQILKGVRIEMGAVVAASSLVTKNVPPNTIVGGIPAAPIRDQIHWIRERI